MRDTGSPAELLLAASRWGRVAAQQAASVVLQVYDALDRD
jgi:hypothetical protein